MRSAIIHRGCARRLDFQERGKPSTYASCNSGCHLSTSHGISTSIARSQAAPPPATTAGPTKNLRELVLEVLQREGALRVEGVPLALVSEQVKGSTASEVRAVLEELVTDGEAFNTIDDLHFSPI